MRNFHHAGRSSVHASRAMAATSHPLATAAALETLRTGGTAMDAALTASATLCVVEPQMTGIGGDCFALYAPGGGDRVFAFNGSGRAPRRASGDWFAEQGYAEIPVQSPHAVTVPGAVDAWSRLSADFGRKPWPELFAPAIDYAANGYPVHARVAFDWAREVGKLAADPTSASQMLVDGAAPREGSVHRQPRLAETLRTIAREGRDGFYRGPVADDIVGFLQGLGGFHVHDDLADHAGEYVTPISTTYRGHEVYECPPNGQGLTALLMLNILSGLRLPQDPLDPRRLHYLAEAARLAYRERDARIADPAFADIPVEALLGEAHAERLIAEVSHERAVTDAGPGEVPEHRDTVYLAVVDADGNCASFINTLFAPFGTGLMAPESGVMLHNRGSGFRVRPRDHPNRLEGGKRPLHTIIPGMLGRDGRTVMPFGVMGAHFQPTGQAYLLSSILDYGLGMQEAIDLPRVFYYQGEMRLEQGIPARTADALAAMGHCITRPDAPHGGAQAIWRDPDTGVLSAGSDPRKDGCALGY